MDGPRATPDLLDGIGFSIELKAFPMDGRLVALPPDGNDDNRK